MKRFIVNMKAFIKMNRYKNRVQLSLAAANQSSSEVDDAPSGMNAAGREHPRSWDKK
jgi:hypothetical protein